MAARLIVLALMATLAVSSFAAISDYDCSTLVCVQAGIKIEGIKVQRDDCILEAQKNIFTESLGVAPVAVEVMGEVTKVDGSYNDRRRNMLQDDLKGFEWPILVVMPAGTTIDSIKDNVNGNYINRSKEDEHLEFLVGAKQTIATCADDWNADEGNKITNITIEESYHLVDSAARAVAATLMMAVVYALGVLLL